MSMLRTRWAAIGAAVALTLGTGGVAMVDATTSSGDRAVYTPITPCRVIDTRPASQVGPRDTPLGPNETHDIVGTGTTGDCTSIPTDATAIALNVTALDATHPTFLTLFATGEPLPLASSLNPAPGQPPTPNAVATNLGTNSQFSIYNKQGTVHVLADAVGYYTHHTHDDRYYTKTQTDNRYATPADLDAAAGASKSISINPRALYLGSTASMTGNAPAPFAGVRLPDSGTPIFDFGFTIPTDYEAGDPIRIQFVWHVDQSNCGFSLVSYYNAQARAGHELHAFSQNLKLLSIGPVSNPANTARRLMFEFVPDGDFGFEPGDTIIVTYYRGTDSCSEDVLIDGIRVLYG